jgi:FkbM family methyltransferase
MRPSLLPLHWPPVAGIAGLARRFLGTVRWYRLLLASGQIDRNGFYDGLTEECMRHWLREDSVCVDVGCHVGNVLRMMIRHAPKGKFYAFEPLPALYQSLLRNFPDPRVKVFDVALHDREGLRDFIYVVTNPGYSGFLRRRYDRPDERVLPIQVRTARLDSVIPSNESVDLIKIDVEGAEWTVLRGAEQIILASRPLILFEHGRGGADFYGTRPSQVYDWLSGPMNLNVSLLDGWLEGRPPLTRRAFESQFRRGSNWYFLAYPEYRPRRPAAQPAVL